MQGVYLRNYLNKPSEEAMKETRKEEDSVSEAVFEATYVNNGGLIRGMSKKRPGCFPELRIEIWGIEVFSYWL